MKKKIFSILAIAAVAFTSCKKEDPTTSELGEATINGTIWSELDYTNATPEGIEGMMVTVIVDTKNWDQDPDASYNYDKQIYTATVAADGSYSLAIPATEVSYTVTLMFGDVFTTRTLASGEMENVKVSQANRDVTIYAGAVLAIDNEATVASVTSNNTETLSSATIYGKVWALQDNGFTPEGVEEWTSGALNVSWRYQRAPFAGGDSTIYTMAIAADGSYTLTFDTEAVGGTAVELDLSVMDFTGSQIRNNYLGTADTTYTGIWSAGGINGAIDGAAFNGGDIMTGQDITLSFTAF